MSTINPKLGIVEAVKAAIAVDADNHWMVYVPNIKTPGRFGERRPNWKDWMHEDTHDQFDAARMRLCLDQSDVVRRVFLVGVSEP